MTDFSFVANAHPAYIESLYKQYLGDPQSVDKGWQLFFKGFEFASDSNGHDKTSVETSVSQPSDLSKEFGVMSIIHGFRDRGHLLSTTNPIRQRRNRSPHLDLNDYNLSDSDLSRSFQSGKEIGLNQGSLTEILDRLRKIYCGNIGFEYTHVENRARRLWLREQIEEKAYLSGYGLSMEERKRILQKLNGAVVFEKFLHTKYIGQKRFSLEGGETTIPALDTIINTGADDKVEEVVIGMAHRGRLNVLVNIMGKTYDQIFNEFEGIAIPDLSFGDGDVKYHLGFSSQVKTTSGKTVHLKLVPNPSHLESVDPVVEGFSRAKADILYDSDYDKILPILIHGDAAIAGQGVVYETVQMSQLKGYYTGGTIHFVINNQVGFTTDFDDARSSTYCTGVAKMVQAPVFHVNGDDPEAVVFATKLAVAYRQKFNSDVFIDMVCYRKHGHNEGDDPKFTQPEMYKFISKHPNPRELYSKRLIEQGAVEKQMAEEMEANFWNELQQRLDRVKQEPLPYSYQEPEQAWRKLKKRTTPEDFITSPVTGIDRKIIDQILEHLSSLPADFKPLGKVNRLLKGMRKLLDNNKLDWALAELLAYGSLLLEGHDVRMSGQDVRRGTFSHRHAVFYDENTYEEYNRINTISNSQGKFRIFNSLLSEFAVLGFEYGYSLASPDTLVLWEAQFGDFYNGAQTIVDQYISAAESKWRRMSGLVMLLPHGYEGQGPEHSSARLERFLQQCAEYNITVANITDPVNLFHALRRQVKRDFRKPLILMSPKSGLRHPLAVSDIEDFEQKEDSRFREFLDDPRFKSTKENINVKRIIFCTGKVYFDLMTYALENNIEGAALCRVEQLYPFPLDQINETIKKYPNAECYWVQEEPSNMGAWTFISDNLDHLDLTLISRKASASPATGFKKVHDMNQERIVKATLEF